MEVFVFLVVAAACIFFVYALVQFSLEERHLRQRRETPLGFPVISSGQIVMPLETPRKKRREDSTKHKMARGWHGPAAAVFCIMVSPCSVWAQNSVQQTQPSNAQSPDTNAKTAADNTSAADTTAAPPALPSAADSADANVDQSGSGSSQTASAASPQQNSSAQASTQQ